MAPIDDTQKISRSHAPGFDGVVVVRKAWKEENNKSKVTGVDRPKNPPMLKLVFFSGNSEIPNFYGVVKNLPLFCLDWSLYSRPYSGYLFSNRSNIYGDPEDLDSTPTTAITVRIRSFIFYNCHSDWEDKIVTCGVNNKLVQISPPPKIF